MLKCNIILQWSAAAQHHCSALNRQQQRVCTCTDMQRTPLTPSCLVSAAPTDRLSAWQNSLAGSLRLILWSLLKPFAMISHNRSRRGYSAKTQSNRLQV